MADNDTSTKRISADTERQREANRHVTSRDVTQRRHLATPVIEVLRVPRLCLESR